MHSAISLQTSKITKMYEGVVAKYDFTKVKTPLAAIQNDSLTLIAMRKRDKGSCDTILAYMIARTAKKFNIGKNINPEQIQGVIESVFEDFYWLKLSDIYLILRNGVRGKYGQIYDRFDESVLLGWIDKYSEERMQVAAEQQRLHHDSVTAQEKDRQYDGFVNNLYKKFKPKIR